MERFISAITSKLAFLLSFTTLSTFSGNLKFHAHNVIVLFIHFINCLTNLICIECMTLGHIKKVTSL